MPTFIQEVESAWNTSTSPKTTAPFNVLAGDTLVCVVMTADNFTMSYAVTNNGAALTWVEYRYPVSSANSQQLVMMRVATVNADRTGMTVTVTRTPSSSMYFGMNVVTVRDVVQTGAVAGAAHYTAPNPTTLGVLTQRAESLMLVAIQDSNGADGTSRAWVTETAGALTELTYYDNIFSAGYLGYHSNTGGQGLKTVGLSAPTDQVPTIAAIELMAAAAVGEAGATVYTRGRPGT